MAEKSAYTIVEASEFSPGLVVTSPTDGSKPGLVISGVGVSALVLLDLSAVERLQVVLTAVAARMRAGV